MTLDANRLYASSSSSFSSFSFSLALFVLLALSLLLPLLLLPLLLLESKDFPPPASTFPPLPLPLPPLFLFFGFGLRFAFPCVTSFSNFSLDAPPPSTSAAKNCSENENTSGTNRPAGAARRSANALTKTPTAASCAEFTWHWERYFPSSSESGVMTGWRRSDTGKSVEYSCCCNKARAPGHALATDRFLSRLFKSAELEAAETSAELSCSCMRFKRARATLAA
mmetsp:Transcript_31688/g.57575  ORF Transcript_31688/g.57575 Transcript_31688/m.57575 type:complete len:224 (+) Transcript_31688:1753-2424(+)